MKLPFFIVSLTVLMAIIAAGFNMHVYLITNEIVSVFDIFLIIFEGLCPIVIIALGYYLLKHENK